MLIFTVEEIFAGDSGTISTGVPEAAVGGIGIILSLYNEDFVAV